MVKYKTPAGKDELKKSTFAKEHNRTTSKWKKFGVLVASDYLAMIILRFLIFLYKILTEFKKNKYTI